MKAFAIFFGCLTLTAVAVGAAQGKPGVLAQASNITFLPAMGRSVMFECGPETFKDTATCVQSTKRLRFEGDWGATDICWRGECRTLESIFIPNPASAPVGGQ